MNEIEVILRNQVRMAHAMELLIRDKMQKMCMCDMEGGETSRWNEAGNMLELMRDTRNESYKFMKDLDTLDWRTKDVN